MQPDWIVQWGSKFLNLQTQSYKRAHFFFILSFSQKKLSNVQSKEIYDFQEFIKHLTKSKV